MAAGAMALEDMAVVVMVVEEATVGQVGEKVRVAMMAALAVMAASMVEVARAKVAAVVAAVLPVETRAVQAVTAALAERRVGTMVLAAKKAVQGERGAREVVAAGRRP